VWVSKLSTVGEVEYNGEWASSITVGDFCVSRPGPIYTNTGSVIVTGR